MAMNEDDQLRRDAEWAIREVLGMNPKRRLTPEENSRRWQLEQELAAEERESRKALLREIYGDDYMIQAHMGVRRMNPAYRGKVPFAEKYGKKIFRR